MNSIKLLGELRIAGRAAALAVIATAAFAPLQATAQIPTLPYMPSENPMVIGSAQCVGGVAGGFPCENVDLLAVVPSFEMSYHLCQLLDPYQNPISPPLLEGDQGATPMTGSDMWGWTTEDANGNLREFALQGLSDAVAFIEVTDPANPIFLGCMTAPTRNFLWRDLKVYNDHIYVVGDFSPELALIPHDHDSGEPHVDHFVHGLQIMDLKRLLTADPNVPQQFIEDTVYGGFDEAHNIVINPENGFAAAVATDTCGTEFHMMDFSKDPLYPEFLGCFNSGLPGAVHDAQCITYRGPDLEHHGKEICLAFMEDQFSIFDMSDPDNVVMLAGGLTYPGQSYVHQGWFTDDFRFIGSNDETDELDATTAGNPHNTRTYIWNAEDLDNPIFVTWYEGPTGSIDHNMYFKGDFLHQANYTSGYRVLDFDPSTVSDGSDGETPFAGLTQVAFFDTNPPDADVAVFGGVWSGYFHFESGAVALSQLNNGELFILWPTDENIRNAGGSGGGGTGDPEEPVDVVPEDGRVHGSGYLYGLTSEDGDSDSDSDSHSSEDFEKINFSFDAKVKNGELKGKLKLKDKELDIKIDAKEITSLIPGGLCNGVDTSAEGGFVFRAKGEFNGTDGAEFRVCGEDNGKHGKAKNGQPADRFYLECTSGCVYNTADRTPDDGIDGGNIHLHDAIIVTESASSAGAGSNAGAAPDSSDQVVITLDPMLADGPTAGQLMTLTAVIETADGSSLNGRTVTLHSQHEYGSSGAIQAVSDALGVTIFTVMPDQGATAYWVSLDGIESNRVNLSGGL
ncbi:MAG: choice-of-anchor B family protein [Gammaproteobacteria bacterium]|nr:choice-of-anchor B family protein [Gammaproteobacteria bacterium]